MTFANTGGVEQEAVNDETLVRAATPAAALDVLCLAYRKLGYPPVDVFVPYASVYGCGADALHNAFCRMMERQANS